MRIASAGRRAAQRSRSATRGTREAAMISELDSRPRATPENRENAPVTRNGRGRQPMKNVAPRAGVALKTVSRVVNDEPGVTPETANRVRNAINELGFRRNDSARLLRKGQTRSLGLIMEDIGDPFYSALSRAVEDVAHWNGSLLFTGSSDEDPQREQELVLALCARRVDGLIVIPASGDHRHLLPEIAAGGAAVCLDPAARGD